ncbi:Gfo/Idh/MocA family oxidoreductase [Neobacillus sp. C211]
MINAIQEDREPLVNGEEGLKQLKIILAIYESARTGHPVQIEGL